MIGCILVKKMIDNIICMMRNYKTYRIGRGVVVYDNFQ